MVNKFEEREFPGRKELLEQIGAIWYDSMEKSAWEENWKEYMEHFHVFNDLLECDTIANQLLNLACNNYDRDQGSSNFSCKCIRYFIHI